MADIILILDESGSMDSQRHTMVNNVNELISEQKRLLSRLDMAPERVNMHIYRFASTVKDAISMPLVSFPKFTDSDYVPDGMTALYDAIGTVLQRFHDSKNKTVLVIATDGQENSSKEYKLPTIQAKLTAKKAEGWSVIYLSETLDTKEQGKRLGVSDCSNVAVGTNKLGSVMKDKHLHKAVRHGLSGNTHKFSSHMRSCGRRYSDDE